MQDLTEGAQRFRRHVVSARAGRYERLATTHRPTALFIGCSDARVVPELITQREPGELFVIRTAGNLVPRYAGADGAVTGDGGVAASVEYAVAVLGVTDIVVCGHSGCGAMTALAEAHDLTALPAVAGWLRHAAAARREAVTVAALVRENVRAQLAHLATHPAVTDALARGALALHGWVYDIATGDIDRLDPSSGEFIPLAAD
ncbi:carbonic anhydrase [Streptomyces sp. LX-29]|uniref:carbonic anhydrase n=1 Tax=Streptomyces sp. LX-29 TaxID=2900152 RepID=UPI00240CE7F2|nr:carbonic anhydrase [Streptomyces sp. LX-29]WFB11902.1 carbonic anhydrase [Streptomyces sp. LX-29]